MPSIFLAWDLGLYNQGGLHLDFFWNLRNFAWNSWGRITLSSIGMEQETRSPNYSWLVSYNHERISLGMQLSSLTAQQRDDKKRSPWNFPFMWLNTSPSIFKSVCNGFSVTYNIKTPNWVRYKLGSYKATSFFLMALVWTHHDTLNEGSDYSIHCYY